MVHHSSLSSSVLTVAEVLQKVGIDEEKFVVDLKTGKVTTGKKILDSEAEFSGIVTGRNE